MAEKRMFTQKITDSDAFLDMPLSSQALYFHLNMGADDDGFVRNPKRIARNIGASEDDLKLLILKRFILCFESGVIVIKHWRMHNALKMDRYHPTEYIDELCSLGIKPNKSYTDRIGGGVVPALPLNVKKSDGEQVEDGWRTNGEQMETFRRTNGDAGLGLDIGLGKDKGLGLDKEEDKEKDKTDDDVKYQTIVDMFNGICVSYPKVQKLSEKRKKAINARLKTYSVDDFKSVFEKAEASSFLKGGNGRDWSANFDWLICDGNMAKVLDGNYDNKGVKGNGRGSGEVYGGSAEERWHLRADVE